MLQEFPVQARTCGINRDIEPGVLLPEESATVGAAIAQDYILPSRLSRHNDRLGLLRSRYALASSRAAAESGYSAA
jgi:hypothetical protein